MDLWYYKTNEVSGKKIKMKKNKIINPPLSFFKAALLALAFIFSIAGQTNYSLAQTATTPTSSASSSKAVAPAKQSYYLISLTWDSEKNTITINKDQSGKPKVSLSDESLTKDNGSGSQFYAFMVNAKLQYAVFDKKNKSTRYKYFLGQWEIPESQKQGEIKITIPFLEGASKIYILDAKTNKLAASVDVFALSGGKVAPKVNTPVPTSLKNNNLQTIQTSSKSTVLGWVIVIVIILILGGVGYWLYRFYKKRKNAKIIDPVESPIAQNKI
jgi:hypothetical protein